jgi:glycosyltransferase involved in cell wall biosynthesis
VNILFVNHEDKMNGASRCLIEIIDELNAQGNTIFVLTSYTSGEFYDELIKRNVHIISYKFNRWIIEKKGGCVKWFMQRQKNKILLFSDLLRFKSLYKVIRTYDIDIIHTNTSVVCIGAWLASKLKVKHVWHLREFGKEDFNMLPTLGDSYTWKYVHNHCDMCIAISKAIQKKYCALIGDDKVTRIYDGVIIPENEKKREYDPTNVNLMIAGRVSRTKGQHEAIAALIELATMGYDKYKLFILGDGDTKHLKDINGFDCVKDRVFFCGYNDNLNAFREKIDVELVCSKSEGFGRITIEAMLMGNPVIGSSTGATVELIQDGLNGFLYNSGDVKDLASKILDITNPNTYEKLSKCAKQYSTSSFSIDINVSQISELYESILHNISALRG